MPSPFPGMDPFLEKRGIFHELHTQMLAEAQGLLQPQIRPKYIARLERHLSEGTVWDPPGNMIALDRKQPDLTLAAAAEAAPDRASTACLVPPLASATEELDEDELELRKQRRVVIYVNVKPRLAVATLELLSPSNKEPSSVGRTRYLDKRSSAFHGGLHWVEIDLLRGGQRPPLAVTLPHEVDYLGYVVQATITGRRHLAYGWKIRDAIPPISIPLLGDDVVTLDLAACFRSAYDRIAADDEADYATEPPPPRLRDEDRAWADALLREKGLRP